MIQDVLTPKWIAEERFGQSIIGVEKLKTKNLDVLFLGTSHVYTGISPMTLYEKYGLCTYCLSTGNQPISGSYILLKKAYQKHKIKNVFLDVSNLFFEENADGIDGLFVYILDNLPFGLEKYNLIKEYTEKVWRDDFLAIMFPIIRTHASWQNLKKENFLPPNTYDYSLGYMMFSKITGSPYQWEEVNTSADKLAAGHGKTVVAAGGETIRTNSELPVYKPEIHNKNLELLLKIKDLCDLHGTNLVLVKVPTMQVPQYYTSAWTNAKSKMVSEIAEEYQLPFLDIIEENGSLLDFTVDSVDGGSHLNVYGAEKCSDYLGEYLIENHYVSGERRSDPVYDKNLLLHQKVMDVAHQQGITDFRIYLQYIKEKMENRTIIFAAAHDYVMGLEPEDFAALEDLGLSLVTQGEALQSYIGIISNGETLYEAISDYELIHEEAIPGGTIQVSSRNWWNLNPGASIIINGTEYSLSGRGLNIVVYDHETDCVIDNAAFDTFDPTKPVMRDEIWKNSMLRNYESALCFDAR